MMSAANNQLRQVLVADGPKARVLSSLGRMEKTNVVAPWVVRGYRSMRIAVGVAGGRCFGLVRRGSERPCNEIWFSSALEGIICRKSLNCALQKVVQVVNTPQNN
ncbi:hypothetical protein Shel_16620 [Slackia heliotrinireducens DSM 20476]|uniref:Uncharacterized protein n=1 Tax=Slackia heliotrinireducens (strain ATCC 29202 / DSM 20476 / NCTC 11029 / RHS 1) TaxID=471855 RepID=C7N6Z6_SLAHD|nr:hypothetical protein Shel_16620 [Slackia heliotrinireducens DSM 20476]